MPPDKILVHEGFNFIKRYIYFIFLLEKSIRKPCLLRGSNSLKRVFTACIFSPRPLFFVAFFFLKSQLMGSQYYFAIYPFVV